MKIECINKNLEFNSVLSKSDAALMIFSTTSKNILGINNFANFRKLCLQIGKVNKTIKVELGEVLYKLLNSVLASV